MNKKRVARVLALLEELKESSMDDYESFNYEGMDSQMLGEQEKFFVLEDAIELIKERADNE